jgi:hypothetical protein
MDPALGVLVRGTTVVTVMAGGLWLGGFFRPEELRVLAKVGWSRAPRGNSVTPTAETTEFAGEIVATDLPDESIAPPIAERIK